MVKDGAPKPDISTVDNFKQALQKSDLILSGLEINRIAKYYQRAGQSINYREFCTDLENTEKINPLRVENPGISVLVRDLSTYMK